MQTETIKHEPREGSKSKEYSYTKYTFADLDDALRYFEFRKDVDGEVVNDEDALVAFFSQEATRRSKVNENAKVNGGIEPKSPVEKLIGMATRIFTPGNETGYVLTKAEANKIRKAFIDGDKAPAQELKRRYMAELEKLDEE